MKKIVTLLIQLLPIFCFGQRDGYFQQKADFTIDVELNTTDNTLDGFVIINYTNHSPDTLRYIWFHLWPNAYKNDRTAFSEQFLLLGRTDFYFSDESQRGYINKLNFTVNGTPAMLEDHPRYIDVAKLVLPVPLPPGKTIRIESPFHEKLPFLFSRGGYDSSFYMVTQWYPKPAVYDKEGWHPMPYLDQGEFFSEFGDYTVHITLPVNYDLAATGQRTQSTVSGKTRTITHSQENVHDFAWFAGKDLQIDTGSMKSISGKTIKLFAYYQKKNEEVWKNSIRFIEETVRNREQDLGPYPYQTITVVEAPPAFSGGMEYPTITSIQQTNDEETLNELINHEVGHNWTYAALANNERDYPWMDEGMTSFYTDHFISRKYRENILKSRRSFIEKRLPFNYDNFIYRYQISQRVDQPIALPSQDFSSDNYYASIYYKAPVWMQRLRDFLGPETFQQCMHAYYQKWKFKHPYPQDFKNVVQEVSGKNVDSIFNLLYTKGNIIPYPPKKFRFRPLFDFSQTQRYHYLFVSPSVGVNHYDYFMAGLSVHNYTLPEPPLHFFFTPMIGTRSKKFTAMGRIGYTIKSYGPIRKFETSLAFSKFDMREFTDSTGKRNYLDFSKLVPAFRLTFRKKSPLSHAESYLQWKTYLIRETNLSFRRDTIHNINIIEYPKESRYVNELVFAHENDRVLYPFSYKAVAQQSDGFVRLSLDANQYFNYPAGGGLNVRIFGGKLIYTNNSKPRYQFKRYQFNMTGPDGYEDYTYSNYFLGRNEFDGVLSQQIMIRDGGFKIRTDLLSNKVGTSDDWLTAVNFNTTLPARINPFSMNTGIISFKAFLDIGTYSSAWQNDAETGKFLYDAGLQIDLAKSLFKIYVPILYSKVYRDYYKSTIPDGKRFWKTISFSIDIQNFRLRKFLDIPN